MHGPNHMKTVRKFTGGEP